MGRFVTKDMIVKPVNINKNDNIVNSSNHLPAPNYIVGSDRRIEDTEKSILIFNDSLPNTYAITTILNDDFAEYFFVFFNSFIENNTWFNGDLVIIYSDLISPLSEKNILSIKKLYKKVIFKNIQVDPYSETIELFKAKANKAFHRLVPSILTIEVFNLTNYDKVLYLDADMIVLGNIVELFKLRHDVIVTRDTSNYNRSVEILNNKDSDLTFNGGFLLLSGDFIRSDHHVSNMLDLFPTLKEVNYLDQNLLNEYLKKYKIIFISSDYNVLKRCFDDSKLSYLESNLKNIKIVHYVGEKPWNEKQKSFEKNYKHIEQLWYNYFNRYTYIDNKNIGDVTLISSGVKNQNLKKILPEITNTTVATTNWGFKYSDFFEIDYYYCTTVDKTLFDSIKIKNFKPKKIWLLTDNVKNDLLNYLGGKHNTIDPFNIMKHKSEEFYELIFRRVYNKKIHIPTSGVSMFFLFSLLNVNSINIVGYNLFTEKNDDGSYKEYGSSKFINPYNNYLKPHSLETDLFYVYLGLKNLINNSVEIKFYDSKIIEDVLNLIKLDITFEDIVKQITKKYYNG